MKKVFEKHETLFCILLIVLYVLVNAFCVENFGTTDLRCALINTGFSLLLLLLMWRLGRLTCYGLAKPKNPKGFLYFLPLPVLVSVNLWGGVQIVNTPAEILFHSITMLNIGFLEEIIFRGFLFRMMEKDNVKSAMAVSAITFGMGHIMNLFLGADLLATVLQIVSAVAIGYLFVLIFRKSGSLVPCIITHSLINTLSVFSSDSRVFLFVASGAFLVIPLAYAGYIHRKTPPS